MKKSVLLPEYANEQTIEHKEAYKELKNNKYHHHHHRNKIRAKKNKTRASQSDFLQPTALPSLSRVRCNSFPNLSTPSLSQQPRPSPPQQTPL